MALHNSPGGTSDLAIIAVIIIIGIYVTLTYVSKSMLISTLGVLLMLGLLAALIFIGYKYYRAMMTRK